jgi:hypothetical protein
MQTGCKPMLEKWTKNTKYSCALKYIGFQYEKHWTKFYNYVQYDYCYMLNQKKMSIQKKLKIPFGVPVGAYLADIFA